MSVFGETLKQARSSKGVTVKEAEQATRINRLHLAALEEENFSALPPLIYQRGIVRNYATYLDLDPAKLIAMFEEARGGAVAPISVVPSVPPVDMPRQWVPNFAVLAFVVVMSAVVFTWFYSAYFAPGGAEPTSTPPVPSVTPPPSDGPTGLESFSIVPTMEPLPTEEPTATATPDEDDEPTREATSEADADRTKEADADDATSESSEVNAASELDDSVDAPVEDVEEPVAEELVEEPVVEEEPVDEEPEAPTGNMTQLQFAPTADVTLSISGDGVVLYDGYVAAGTVIGPFSAVSFEIYTTNAAATSITNLDDGNSFVVSFDEAPLNFYLP
jgi:cytoskeleton protein RodZ